MGNWKQTNNTNDGQHGQSIIWPTKLASGARHHGYNLTPPLTQGVLKEATYESNKYWKEPL